MGYITSSWTLGCLSGQQSVGGRTGQGRRGWNQLSADARGSRPTRLGRDSLGGTCTIHACQILLLGRSGYPCGIGPSSRHHPSSGAVLGLDSVNSHQTTSPIPPSRPASSSYSSHRRIMASGADRLKGAQGRASSVSAASENSQTAQEYALRQPDQITVDHLAQVYQQPAPARSRCTRSIALCMSRATLINRD